jgi:nucleoid DNA-binding protein
MMAKAKKALTKSALYAHLAEATDLKKSQISDVIDKLGEVAMSELKKNGLFTFPGIARLKIRKVKAVKGGQKKINPITKTEYITKDRPAFNKVTMPALRPASRFLEPKR